MYMEVSTRCLLRYNRYSFDHLGFASTLVLVKLLVPGIKTMAYVHYPFISHDMIEKVRTKRADFNNSQTISKSAFLSKAKLYYYLIILEVYKLIGRAVDFAQTNSSWTHNHMSLIWNNLKAKDKLYKLYPPCTVDKLLKMKKI